MAAQVSYDPIDWEQVDWSTFDWEHDVHWTDAGSTIDFFVKSNGLPGEMTLEYPKEITAGEEIVLTAQGTFEPQRVQLSIDELDENGNWIRNVYGFVREGEGFGTYRIDSSDMGPGIYRIYLDGKVQGYDTVHLEEDFRVRNAK